MACDTHILCFRELPIGKNIINEILVLIATWSGYENPEGCTAHGKRHKSLSKVANAGVSASLVKGLGGRAHLNTTTNYIFPDQQAVEDVVKAKHGSPSKICGSPSALPANAPALAPVPAPAPAPARAPSPAPPSPSSSAEESQAPALFVDESPVVSVKDLKSSMNLPLQCPPTSLYYRRRAFSSDTLFKAKVQDPLQRSGIILAICHTIVLAKRDMIVLANHDTIVLENSDTRIAALVESIIAAAVDTRITAVVTRITAVDTRIIGSYQPRYNNRKPPPYQEPQGLSFGETPSYKPRYEEPLPPSNNERKQQFYKPLYEERKLAPRRSYKPQYKKHKPAP
eukprot:jgi/Psemu1/6694/gm1.6694_g